MPPRAAMVATRASGAKLSIGFFCTATARTISPARQLAAQRGDELAGDAFVLLFVEQLPEGNGERITGADERGLHVLARARAVREERGGRHPAVRVFFPADEVGRQSPACKRATMLPASRGPISRLPFLK